MGNGNVHAAKTGISKEIRDITLVPVQEEARCVQLLRAPLFAFALLQREGQPAPWRKCGVSFGQHALELRRRQVKEDCVGENQIPVLTEAIRDDVEEASLAALRNHVVDKASGCVCSLYGVAPRLEVVGVSTETGANLEDIGVGGKSGDTAVQPVLEGTLDAGRGLFTIGVEMRLVRRQSVSVAR